MIFYGLKMDVVQFATALQLRFGKDSPLTTITRVGKSEVYCASTAIDTSSDVIVANLAQDYSLQPTNTWSENTPVMLSQRKRK